MIATQQSTKQGDGGKNLASDIFNDEQAAAYVGGIKARAIRDWRTRRGLPFLKITNKIIRIRRADLDRWLAQSRIAVQRG